MPTPLAPAEKGSKGYDDFAGRKVGSMKRVIVKYDVGDCLKFHSGCCREVEALILIIQDKGY